jgi:hypothetical protein
MRAASLKSEREIVRDFSKYILVYATQSSDGLSCSCFELYQQQIHAWGVQTYQYGIGGDSFASLVPGQHVSPLVQSSSLTVLQTYLDLTLP